MATAPTTDKTSQIVTDCVYRIATGVWPVGCRLPSLRQGAEIWGVDPLTVKRSYAALKARGLVEIAPRSGVFVRDNAPVFSLRRHRSMLESLFVSVQDRIAEETGLSTLGSFRYLARLAEHRSASAPECAFVECTEFQAGQLAAAVRDSIEIPCSAIRVDDLVSGRRPLMPSERTVFTTGFHHAEVAGALASMDVRVVQIAVRFSVARAVEVVAAGRGFAVFCLESEQGELVGEEVRSLAGSPAKPMRVVPVDPRGAAQAVASAEDGESILTSPTVWESLPLALRERAGVFAYAYGLDADAVRTIASAVGLPLGDAGCVRSVHEMG